MPQSNNDNTTIHNNSIVIQTSSKVPSSISSTTVTLSTITTNSSTDGSTLTTVAKRTEHDIPTPMINFIMAKRTKCCNVVPGKKKRGSKSPCRLTCYTPHACGNDGSSSSNTAMTNGLYPFSSQSEKEWYTMTIRQDSMLSFREHNKRICDEYMDREDDQANTTTLLQWCQPQSLSQLQPQQQQQQQAQQSSSIASATTPTTTTSLNLTMSIPTGCSRFGMVGRSGPFDRTFVFPKGKLLFCGIPKVGITQWLKFLRFVLGAGDYQSLPFYKRDIHPFRLDRLSPHRQQEVFWSLSNSTWTKAIFLRDPAERLLSAYLDKVEQKRFDELQVDFQQQTTNTSFRVIMFHNWVRALETTPFAKCQNRTGPSWCWDPHWRPQVYSCGIRKMLSLFDFVGSISHAASHTKALLQKVNLWNDYGAHYLVSEKYTKRSSCQALPPNPVITKGPNRVVVSSSSSSIGFQQNVKDKNDHHTTNSKSKMSIFFTNEIQDIVKRLYHQDYELWNALNNNNNNNNNNKSQDNKDNNVGGGGTDDDDDDDGTWVTGRVLAERLNPACREQKP